MKPKLIVQNYEATSLDIISTVLLIKNWKKLW